VPVNFIYLTLKEEIVMAKKYEGTHSEGLGWTPMGDFCGECSRRTCQGCPVAEEEKAQAHADELKTGGSDE
jgi:hypothetical protein